MKDSKGVEIKAGGYITYKIGTKPIRDIITGEKLCEADPQTLKFPVIEYGGLICVKNNQDVILPVTVFKQAVDLTYEED